MIYSYVPFYPPCTLYVVQCKTPRTWYVGTTLRARHKRFAEHFAGVGCKWTRRHGCKRIVLHFPVSCAEASRAENDVWMHYARIYGPERVRGGTSRSCNGTATTASRTGSCPRSSAAPAW